MWIGRCHSRAGEGPSRGGGSVLSHRERDWNTAVSIDQNIGTVVLTDPKGEETGRFRLGIQSITDSAVIGSTVIAASTDNVAVADLSAPEDIITIDIESAGELFRPSGTVATVIAPDTGRQRGGGESQPGSYTHLTLPPIYSASTSRVAASSLSHSISPAH